MSRLPALAVVTFLLVACGSSVEDPPDVGASPVGDNADAFEPGPDVPDDLRPPDVSDRDSEEDGRVPDLGSDALTPGDAAPDVEVGGRDAPSEFVIGAGVDLGSLARNGRSLGERATSSDSPSTASSRTG